MKDRILLPSSRYIMGFKNKEERIIQRAFQDFFYELYDEKEDIYMFQRGFSKALTLILFANEVNAEAEFIELILLHFPKLQEDYLIEEIEIKFRDEDLLLLQLHFNHQLSNEAISARVGCSPEEVIAKINKYQQLWGDGQEMTLEDYLIQIEKRQWYKRLMQNPIPLKPNKKKKKSKISASIGEINKVDSSLWGKIKNLFL